MTNELIKVKEDNGKKVVSARELHEGLEIKTQFTKWFDRMCEYGFEENQDFIAISQKRLTAQGNETTFIDYAITLDMAKEISMIQRTPLGKEYRKYFIECEKDLNEIHQKAIEQKTITLEEINNIRFKTPTKTCLTFQNVDADVSKILVKEFIEYAKNLPTDERIRKCKSAINGLTKLHDNMAKLSVGNIGDCYNINKLIEEVKELQHKTENMNRGQLIAHRNTKIKELEKKLETTIE